MKERGMIFNTEMVKAILEGRKTQTRRPVKPRIMDCSKSHQHYTEAEWKNDPMKLIRDVRIHKNEFYCELCGYGIMPNGHSMFKSPFGVPGDRIYVRETWNHSFLADDDVIRNREYVYYADGDHVCQKWRPSIHMPREASRLFLQITDVRVEKVSGISEEDAIAEGIKNLGFTEGNPHKALYAQLYESIYGPDSWEKDWVWVYKFKVL